MTDLLAPRALLLVLVLVAPTWAQTAAAQTAAPATAARALPTAKAAAVGLSAAEVAPGGAGSEVGLGLDVPPP